MRYFFDFNLGNNITEDNIGGEHATPALAREEALICLATLMKDKVTEASRHPFGVGVRDAAGLSVFKASMTLSEGWTV
jgi:hypothetical protein